MGVVKIDGVPEPMQPDTLNWDQPRRLGFTGAGKPVFAPYWVCRLGFSRMTTVQYERWFAMWQSGNEYTVELPHPESGEQTEFTCRMRDFSQRLDTTDACRAAASGVDIVLGGIEVS